MTQPNAQEFNRTFAKIGLLSFGGPAAQIALMHRELVDERAWLTERQFAGALSFCMLLPGPEAMQLATYAGWRLRGLRGGLLAGLLFVLPGAFVIWALAVAYILYGAQPWAVAAFMGVKAAVITIVVQALFKLSQKALTAWPSRLIALGAFLGLFALGAPYPLILALAALAGSLFFATKPEALTELTPAPPLSQSLRTLALGLALWLAPLAALFLSGQSFLTELAAYFAQLALFSFGGAYALLGWMTQTLVQDHRLDHIFPNDRCPRPCRNHAWPANPCDTIHSPPCRSRPRRAGPRRSRRAAHPLDGVHALLSLHLPWRTLSGAPLSNAPPAGRPHRDHSGRHRGDRQPLALVRGVCALAKRRFRDC